MTMRIGVLMVLVLSGCFCGPPENECSAASYCSDAGAAVNCRTTCTIACSSKDQAMVCQQGCRLATIPAGTDREFFAFERGVGDGVAGAEVAYCVENDRSAADAGP